MKLCGAKTKHGPCKAKSMPNGRCYHHGGKSPGGPLTAGGRYSKFLPTRLAARYIEAEKDAQLLSITAEIAVIDTRLSEVMERLDTSESTAAWVVANQLFADMNSGDPKKMIPARVALGEVLEKGLNDARAWSEIVGLIEQRRKCAETESKRLAQAEQFITAKQANVLMAAIVKLVSDNVSDADARARIAAGLAALATHGSEPRDLGSAGAVN